MRIKDMLARCGQFLSLEFFPPKEKDKWPAFFGEVERLKALNPLFVSVTYGAGGSTRDYTLEIVTRLKRDYALEPMAHLTCVGAGQGLIRDFLAALEKAGVNNVLALRGDPPKGQEDFVPDNEEFQHASDLVTFIRSEAPDLGVGVACYPEKHPQAASLDEDIKYLKYKLDQGADFAVCQLFFDNRKYYDFVAKARAMGVTKPLIPAILPVLGPGTIKRAVTLSGSSVPPGFLESLERAQETEGPEAARAIGLAHARKQIKDLLASGVPGVHLYTLNQSAACLEIMADLEVSRGKPA